MCFLLMCNLIYRINALCIFNNILKGLYKFLYLSSWYFADKNVTSKITAFIFLSFNAFYFIEHYIELILFNDRVIFSFQKSPFNKICRQLRSYLAAKNRNLIFEFHCVTIAVLYRYKGFYSFVMLLL